MEQEEAVRKGITKMKAALEAAKDDFPGLFSEDFARRAMEKIEADPMMFMGEVIQAVTGELAQLVLRIRAWSECMERRDPPVVEDLVFVVALAHFFKVFQDAERRKEGVDMLAGAMTKVQELLLRLPPLEVKGKEGVA